MRCFWMYRESQGKDLMVSGTVRWAALGAEVPGYRQQQLTQTLIVHLLKTHFFTHRSLILKSQQNRIELVTRPDGFQGGGRGGKGRRKER